MLITENGYSVRVCLLANKSLFDGLNREEANIQAYQLAMQFLREMLTNQDKEKEKGTEVDAACYLNFAYLFVSSHLNISSFHGKSISRREAHLG